MNAFELFAVVRLKRFTLDERLVLGRLGVLAAADRTAVAAQLAKLLPQSPERMGLLQWSGKTLPVS